MNHEFNQTLAQQFKLDHKTEAYFIILNKRHDIINGKGWQCKKEVTRTVTYSPLFGENSASTTRETISLTKDECLLMVTSKKCSLHQMTQEGNLWFIEQKPELKYKLWSSLIHIGVKCSINPKIIIGEKLTDNLFNSGHSACTAMDEECILHDSIIIWESSHVIHTCPYEYITDGFFRLKWDNVITNPDKQLTFQINEKINVCGQTGYSTRRLAHSTHTTIPEMKPIWTEYFRHSYSIIII
jgi:hypothetical protein